MPAFNLTTTAMTSRACYRQGCRLFWRALAMVLALVLSACAMQRTTGDTILSPRLFPAPNANFQQYIDAVRQHVARVSMPHRSDSDIELNLPFALDAAKGVPYRGKFLLIHGLNDSAFVWRDMAQEMAAMGYDVRAILLPGHGSHPRQMLEVSYRQWLDVAREHLALWRTDDTPMYIGGFSMGGVLATLLVIENPDISGLLLVSPAWDSRLDKYLRWAWIYRYFRPWLFGHMMIEDNPSKYNSIPVNAAAQYYRLLRVLKKRWQQPIDVPALIVVSADDSVVDIDYVRQRFAQDFTSEKRALLLYSNDEEDKAAAFESIRGSAYPERRILNQSHLSLINSPANVLLGEVQPLLICNGDEPEVFFGCMRATGHWFGAQNTPSPDAAKVARSTYNPDFSGVLEIFRSVFH